MDIFKKTFSFLYIIDWETGEEELSRSRVALFSAAVFLVLLAITLIIVLQSPNITT